MSGAWVVGRTPRSAADALVGLLAPCRMLNSLFRQRDEGVPRGPGGPPHHLIFLLLLALPALAQGFEDLKFEHLAQGYRFTEGPAWSKEGGYLVFSDTPSDRLMKWVPGTEITVYRTD